MAANIHTQTKFLEGLGDAAHGLDVAVVPTDEFGG